MTIHLLENKNAEQDLDIKKLKTIIDETKIETKPSVFSTGQPNHRPAMNWRLVVILTMGSTWSKIRSQRRWNQFPASLELLVIIYLIGRRNRWSSIHFKIYLSYQDTDW